METINMTVECPYCRATGVYKGMGEGDGCAVVCNKCEGTGAYEYKYSYTKFTERKTRDDIKRVYLSGYGYKIGLGEIDFQGIATINMNEEGVSYDNFLNGGMPEHIKSLGCPMIADQGACHKIKGFVDECNALNGGWISLLTTCKHQGKKDECWKRFSNCSGKE